MKCKTCKQDVNDHRRVSELKKEVFRLKLTARKIALAGNSSERKEIIESNKVLLEIDDSKKDKEIKDDEKEGK